MAVMQGGICPSAHSTVTTGRLGRHYCAWLYCIRQFTQCYTVH